MSDKEKTKIKPEFEAYAVAGEGEKKRWSKIGVGFHKGGSDYITIELDALPVNGKLVLKIIPESDGEA